MQIYNAFFEDMDGFTNTQKGADRVRAIAEDAPSFDHALDALLAVLLDRNEDATGVKQDVDYIIDQLKQFRANVSNNA
jgi:hypothetical protein